VKRDSHPATIRVLIALVTSSLSSQDKSIAQQSLTDFSRGHCPKAPVIDGHRVKSCPLGVLQAAQTRDQFHEK
jgi:hypothetical protein